MQIWITLIANLLLMILKRGLTRSWSFSGLATMVRIVLMYYVDFYSLFNHPEKDWKMLLNQSSKSPPIASLFDQGGLGKQNRKLNRFNSTVESPLVCPFRLLPDSNKFL